MNYSLRKPQTVSIPRGKELSVIETLLLNRDIQYEEIQHYLNTDDKDILLPESIQNLEQGVKMLISHISNNDKIIVQVDSDCDGFTSSAILLNYLYCLFPTFVKNNIKYILHKGKEHGISMEEIPADVKLVIAPDSSSNEYDIHENLYKQGIDVLVIDHHNAKEISQYACVINNQLCNYPTKSLSGAGMVYKFCSYIDKLLNVNYADNFLDLVALGLIADMVDIRDFETKHLINLGLNKIRNPYFLGMTQKNNFKIEEKGLCPMTVAFYVAPFVNAVCRVGEQDEKIVVFESMLDFKGYELIASTKRGSKGVLETRVEQACRVSTNVKSRQTKARDNGIEIVNDLIEKENLLDNKFLIVKLPPQKAVNKGLTGLIANELANKYQRPTIILNYYEEEIDGKICKIWKGSGRGYDKSGFTNLQDFLINDSSVYLAEGHDNALGVYILDDEFDNFLNYINTNLKNFEFVPRYQADYIYSGNDIDFYDLEQIPQYQMLWGQKMEEPLIVFEHLKVPKEKLRFYEKGALKIELSNSISLIKKGATEEDYNDLYSEFGCSIINVVGRCERNVYNQRVSLTIVIEDYEIVSKTKYYF